MVKKAPRKTRNRKKGNNSPDLTLTVPNSKPTMINKSNNQIMQLAKKAKTLQIDIQTSLEENDEKIFRLKSIIERITRKVKLCYSYQKISGDNIIITMKIKKK